MEIRELRAFAVVAEEGSLSAAARRLHLSPSALSQTIQSLERQLGVQLLLRSRTGVTTTEAGAILLREGRALIAQYDRMLAAVAGRDEAGPDILKVGIPLELPADLLPGVLTELSITFPLTRPGPYAVDDQEPDAYYIAYSGPYDVDEQAGTVAHHLQVSVIPSWLGTTQLRRVQFRESGTLVLSASEPHPRDGVPTTTTITWSRQPPR